MVTSYEDLHYDVLNIGKQEAWMGYTALDSLIRATRAAKKTEFVSANLVDVHTRRPITNPTMIKDYGSVRVGIIGLLARLALWWGRMNFRNYVDETTFLGRQPLRGVCL